MAKFFGLIGYAETSETSPGIWTEEITERTYFGDVLENNVRRNVTSDSTNDDLKISTRISIVSDPYAIQHFHSIKYVEFMGVKWNVTEVNPNQRPRLILTLGGVYNGKQA